MYDFHTPKPTPPLPPIPELTKEEEEEISINITELQEKDAPKPSPQSYRGPNGESWSRYAIAKPPENFHTISTNTNTLEERIKTHLEEKLLTDTMIRIYYESIRIKLIDQKSLTKTVKRAYYFVNRRNKAQFTKTLQIPCIPQNLMSKEFTSDMYTLIKNGTIPRTKLENLVIEICTSAKQDEFEKFKNIFLTKYTALFNLHIKNIEQKFAEPILIALRPRYRGPNGESWSRYATGAPHATFHTISNFHGKLSQAEIAVKNSERNEIIKRQKTCASKTII